MLIDLVNEAEHIFLLHIVYFYLFLIETFKSLQNEPGTLFQASSGQEGEAREAVWSGLE